jgi:hypothetical protein
MAFSRPEKLTDNVFVESFNETFRAECLNAHWFTSLTEAQHIMRTGALNATRVRLTGLSGRGHPTNSPMKSRLAAISLDYKQLKTRPEVDTESRSDQVM